ncbi:MAG TPA: FKBP-type peptidyl-prolyl cis-trans isomerase [Solirubrobacterales bacterium]|nr:FKBP-type peptidyl-prolyl cis-trans isomerase [Solirubrobacterales bacterium]
MIIFALLALLVGGCGGGSDSSSSTTASKPFRIPFSHAPIVYEKEIRAKEKSNGLYGPEPKVIMPEGTPPKIIANRDLIEGIGHMAYPGSKVTIQYVAVDYKTGKKLGKSSWEQGKPLTFTIGKGEVMEGLEQGVEGMEVADRREMVIPPELNTGPEVPAGIPPNTRVIILADMLRVQGGGEEEPAEKEPAEEKPSKKSGGGELSKAEASKIKKPKVTVPSGPPPKKLVIKDLKKGKGPTAEAGDEVLVQYVGVDYKNGKEFDSSWSRNEPFPFTLGSNSVIPGWEQGVEGMKLGGRRELIIPPELAYGPSGSPPAIGPNETLIFVIDLLAIK